MHSKIYVVKLGFETNDISELKEYFEEFIDNYEYGSGDIDYIQTIEEYVCMGLTQEERNKVDALEIYNEILQDKINDWCEEIYAEKVNDNTIKVTKEGLKKYYSNVIESMIDKLNGYKQPNGEYDVDKFIKNYYNFTHEFDSQDPKYYSMYGYLEEDGEFLRTLYNAMGYHNLEELTIEIVDIYDYHC